MVVWDLGMDPWHLVEPLGFVGGILLLWKSHIVDFQVIRDGVQGVYGVVEVRNTKTSFVFLFIYGSLKLWKRK